MNSINLETKSMPACWFRLPKNTQIRCIKLIAQQEEESLAALWFHLPKNITTRCFELISQPNFSLGAFCYSRLVGACKKHLKSRLKFDRDASEQIKFFKQIPIYCITQLAGPNNIDFHRDRIFRMDRYKQFYETTDFLANPASGPILLTIGLTASVLGCAVLGCAMNRIFPGKRKVLGGSAPLALAGIFRGFAMRTHKFLLDIPFVAKASTIALSSMACTLFFSQRTKPDSVEQDNKLIDSKGPSFPRASEIKLHSNLSRSVQTAIALGAAIADGVITYYYYSSKNLPQYECCFD